MTITQRDKRILRDLAKRVAEIGSLPIMTKRREMWKRHNRLERVRPMILVFPEGSWRELLPQSVLCCEKERTRWIEWELRSRIYRFEHIHDDMVIEKTWVVNKTVTTSGWGLEPGHIPSDNPTGASINLKNGWTTDWSINENFPIEILIEKMTGKKPDKTVINKIASLDLDIINDENQVF